MSSCAEKIRQYRELNNMSVAICAEKFSISARTLQFIEKGEHSPTVETLLKMAQVMDCSMEDIIDDSIKVKPHRESVVSPEDIASYVKEKILVGKFSKEKIQQTLFLVSEVCVKGVARCEKK